jgi:hypothetical protein
VCVCVEPVSQFLASLGFSLGFNLGISLVYQDQRHERFFHSHLHTICGISCGFSLGISLVYQNRCHETAFDQRCWLALLHRPAFVYVYVRARVAHVRVW